MISGKLEGFKEALQGLGELQKKMPSIAARTLTTLAYDAKKEVEGWLPRVLDRPTPYTMRSLFVFQAEKNDLRAAVAFRSEFGKMPRTMMDSIEASRSMRVQVFGGARRHKASERTLLSNGITTTSRSYLVPAKGAQRDAYGNVPGSFMNKVLFQGVKRGSASQGYHRPLNNRGQHEAKRKGQYFVMRRDGVARGIYQNMGKKAPPLPVFLFAEKAQYKKRVSFYAIAQAVINRNWQKRFNESYDVVAAKYLR
jgi:hypothetical protein